MPADGRTPRKTACGQRGHGPTTGHSAHDAGYRGLPPAENLEREIAIGEEAAARMQLRVAFVTTLIQMAHVEEEGEQKKKLHIQSAQQPMLGMPCHACRVSCHAAHIHGGRIPPEGEHGHQAG